jgi:hypothetical protein
MLARVRVQNYLSFGKMQTAELRGITLLVGANNSGKSNFLRFPDVFRAVPLQPHRPELDSDDPALKISWDANLVAGSNDRIGTWSYSQMRSPPRVAPRTTETIEIAGTELLKNPGGGQYATFNGAGYGALTGPVIANTLLGGEMPEQVRRDIETLIAPVSDARNVHLRVDALRNGYTLGPAVTLGADGSQLSAVLATWLLESPEKMEEFNQVLASCLPEMRRVLVRPVQGPHVRLVFEQSDGERFDATEVSDGVLVFAGLIAHAMVAPHGGLLLLEEPERGIHPRRMGDFVELLRTLVEKRGTQFIMATHSPALLNVFRDEPESILLFRRTPSGTTIRCLADMPDLVESLSRSDPGEMLANGVFNEDLGG